MKNRIFILLLLVLCLVLVLPSAAEENYDRLVDQAGLLNEDERTALHEALDTISLAHSCDVVIWTLDSLDGKDITAYADDTFDAYYGFDGILFLISMAEREWAISTCGSCIDIFSDARQANMSDAMLSFLSDGRYAEAFSIFTDYCDGYLTQGAPVYTDQEDDFTYIGFENDPVAEPNYLGALVFSPAVGLTTALIYTAILRAQLNSVAPAKGAANYTRGDSFHLTRSEEVFLYRNVARHAKPQNNSSSGSRSGSSTHRSSSGRSHGGSRGRF